MLLFYKKKLKKQLIHTPPPLPPLLLEQKAEEGKKQTNAMIPPQLCSRPISRQCSRPISRLVLDRFPTPDGSPIKKSCAPIPSRQPTGFPPSRPIPIPP